MTSQTSVTSQRRRCEARERNGAISRQQVGLTDGLTAGRHGGRGRPPSFPVRGWMAAAISGDGRRRPTNGAATGSLTKLHRHPSPYSRSTSQRPAGAACHGETPWWDRERDVTVLIVDGRQHKGTMSRKPVFEKSAKHKDRMPHYVDILYLCSRHRHLH